MYLCECRCLCNAQDITQCNIRHVFSCFHSPCLTSQQMQVISSLLQIHPYRSLPLHSVYSRFSLGVKTDCEATDIICFKAACINCACLVAMVTFSDLIISKSDFMWDGSHTDEMMELEYRWKEAGANRCHLFVLFLLSRADLTQEQFDKKISSFSKW